MSEWKRSHKTHERRSQVSLADQIKTILEGLRNSKNIPAGDEPILINRLGRKLEQSFFGFTLPDDANLFYGPEEYSNFFDSLEEMMRTQPQGYDPRNPSGGCNKQFLDAVRSRMPVGQDQFKLYIAIGTKLDFWHGADAVIRWRGVNVTLDVTVDPNKEYKADFCIFPEDIESGRVYTTIAQDIVSLIIKRYLDRFDAGRVHCIPS